MAVMVIGKWCISKWCKRNVRLGGKISFAACAWVVLGVGPSVWFASKHQSSFWCPGFPQL